MESVKYEQVLAELETIAEQMERGECDIDELSSQVKRARELIKLCKDRLKSVDDELKEVIAEED